MPTLRLAAESRGGQEGAPLSATLDFALHHEGALSGGEWKEGAWSPPGEHPPAQGSMPKAGCIFGM